MKHTSVPIVVGSLYGFLAIVLGAYTDHVLRNDLSAHDIDSLRTALRYQLIHALFLMVLGFACMNANARNFMRCLKVAAILCALGTLFFSGGIELSIIGHCPMALKIVPLGGMLLMASWLIAGASGFIKR